MYAEEANCWTILLPDFEWAALFWNIKMTVYVLITQNRTVEQAQIATVKISSKCSFQEYHNNVAHSKAYSKQLLTEFFAWIREQKIYAIIFQIQVIFFLQKHLVLLLLFFWDHFIYIFFFYVLEIKSQITWMQFLIRGTYWLLLIPNLNEI